MAAHQEFKNHGYYVEGKYTKTIETAPAGKVKVFFDNTIENLKNVYCYIYNGTEASVEWPGVKMQLDEETEYNGKKGYYSLRFLLLSLQVVSSSIMAKQVQLFREKRFM